MRLTNYMRDGFVEAVMQDVPIVEYGEQQEQLLLALAVERLPSLLKRVWSDASLRGHIKCPTHGHIGLMLEGNRSFHLRAAYPGEYLELSEETVAELRRLELAHNKQHETTRALRSKLKGVAYGCTTTEAASTALPRSKLRGRTAPEIVKTRWTGGRPPACTTGWMTRSTTRPRRG